MHVRRGVLAIMFGVLLALGAAVSMWGIFVSITEYGVETLSKTVPRGATSIVTLMVTAAFAIVTLKRGFRPLAFPLFGLSFCAVAASLAFSLGGHMKNWAPATPAEVTRNDLVALVIVAAILVIVTLAIWLSGRRGRRLVG